MVEVMVRGEVMVVMMCAVFLRVPPARCAGTACGEQAACGAMSRDVLRETRERGVRFAWREMRLRGSGEPLCGILVKKMQAGYSVSDRVLGVQSDALPVLSPS